MYIYTYSGWSDKCELGDGWLQQNNAVDKVIFCFHEAQNAKIFRTQRFFVDFFPRFFVDFFCQDFFARAKQRR
jgi:hypothetical protein